VPLWPLVLYFVLVVLLVASMIGASALLGERHHERATDAPYEGGIVSEGSARVRLSARFYLIAMFFVIFDLESVFLFAWAVAARELGWVAYTEALIFTLVLVAALVYLWRVGALDWSPGQTKEADDQPPPPGVTPLKAVLPPAFR
jgi:NADH-quinone oxidoreductase subunit A